MTNGGLCATVTFSELDFSSGASEALSLPCPSPCLGTEDVPLATEVVRCDTWIHVISFCD